MSGAWVQLMWPSAGALVLQPPKSPKLRRLPQRRASCSLRRPLQGPERTELEGSARRSGRIRSPASWPAWPPLQAKRISSVPGHLHIQQPHSGESGSKTRSWLLLRLLKAVFESPRASDPPSFAHSRPCQAGDFSIWLWTPCCYNRYRGAGASTEPASADSTRRRSAWGSCRLEGCTVRVTWFDVYFTRSS